MPSFSKLKTEADPGGPCLPFWQSQFYFLHCYTYSVWKNIFEIESWFYSGLNPRSFWKCGGCMHVCVCVSVWYHSIGVNAAGVAGVATPQYLTCRGRPVLRPPQYFDKCFIFSFQRNFWIPQVAVIFICNAFLNFSSIITDLFTDFSQLAVPLTPTHISNDLIITRK